MKLLSHILKNIHPIKIIGDTNIPIHTISNNSNTISPQSLFVAIKGTSTDGHLFINETIQKGATAIVCEKTPETLHPNITYIIVNNSAEALGHIAHSFYDEPTKKLQLIGITGTNGKTTSVTLLHQLFSKLGFKCGLISTIENKIHHQSLPSTHTTPDAIQMNQLLHQMHNAKCEYVFTEVSSIGIHQKRTTGLLFKGAAFTNLTHDHLDYHKTFENYRDCKKQLFDNLPHNSFAITNKDDKNGLFMIQNTKAIKYTYAVQSLADFKAKILEQHITGTLIEINGKQVWTKLIGKFNVYNTLLAYSIAKICGIDELSILKAISDLNPAKGRFQIYHYNNITGIVDYAHTPDALENVLKTINDLKQPHQKLITIIGCGGNRDTTKRPLMAKIACQLSDKIILTSDNPRNEDPLEIIQDMEKGISITDKRKTINIVNREEAIKTAIHMAQKEDIILIAGKGHENYQEIKGIKYPFNDYQIFTQYIHQLKN